MAINMDAIRQKLQSLQSKTGQQNNLWKPEPGKQQVRIVPYQHDKDNPFIELYFHYGLNGKNYLSPISFGRQDPIVEFAEKLKATGNSDDWKLSRKLEPKMRTYVPVLVRGEESEGVKFWGFGKQVYQELLGFISDPDYGDISDPVNGRDIAVEFTPAEGAGQFPKTTIRVKPNQTKVSEDKNVVSSLTNQKVITDIFKEPSYDDLTAALQVWLNPEDSEEAESGKAEATNGTEGTKKVDDVSAAFEELFNK
jgi:hypothetical protein